MPAYEFSFRVCGIARVQADTMNEAWTLFRTANLKDILDVESLDGGTLVEVTDIHTLDEVPVNQVP